jgi:hypothetical protein
LPDFAVGVKDLSLGRRHPSSRGKYNENRVFAPQRGRIGGYGGLLFHRVTRANSLLSGSIEYQLNFAAEQRIQTAYQSKNNGVSAGAKNRKI